jgi:hypothetical protein
MGIQGLRDTFGFVTDQRPKNWRQGIFLLNPNGKMMLTGLTSLMKSKVTDDPEFYWWDKQLQSRRVKLTASITAATSTLTVDTDGNDSTNNNSGALGLKEGDILYSEQTGERMRVSANPTSDTSVPVTRGFSGSTATAITYNGSGVNPFLVVIGSAYKEASQAPSGVNFDPNKRYNLTQIFRNTLEMSRTAQKTRLRTGDGLEEAKREVLELHGIDMERAFWFGKRAENTVGGNIIRTCDGVISVIDSGNIKTVTTDYASGLTMAGLEEYMYNIFKFGSSEKMGICGNRGLLTIQQVIRKNANWQFVSGIKEFGMNVSRFTTPFGELVLKSHPLFNYQYGGTTGTASYYGMESWLWVLDLDNFSYRYLTDSDTKYEPKLETNGLDGMQSGWLTEASIQIAQPKTHYLLKNLVRAAVDS